MNLAQLETFKPGPSGGLEILALIPKAIALIGDVPKLRKRKAGGGDGSFNFRGIDDALNYISPVLAHLKITPVTHLLDITHSTCNVQDKEGKPKVMNRSELVIAVQLIAPDGSWVRHVCGGMATDYNDGTASNKAHSAGEKYALFFGFMVPVERVALEDADADEDQGNPDNAPSHVEGAGNALKPAERPGDDKAEELVQVSLQAVQAAFKKRDAATLKQMIARAENNARFSDEQRNTVVRTIRECLGKLPPEPKPAAGSNPETKSRPAGAPPPTGTKPPAGKSPTQQNPSTKQGASK